MLLMSSSVIKFVINGAETLVPEEATRGLETNAQHRPIVVPGATAQHVGLAVRLTTGPVLSPMVDIGSHRDVYIVIVLAKAFGLTTEDVVTGMPGWVNEPRWIELSEPEYMYTVWCENEYLADFAKFFRLCENAFDWARVAKESGVFESAPERLIEMLTFLGTYNFTTCFKNNSAAVQARIKWLETQRKEAWEVFLVDPHTLPISYFERPMKGAPTWDCESISVVDQIEVGQPTIAAADVALERLHEFAFGLLRGPLRDVLGVRDGNPLVARDSKPPVAHRAFPFDCAVIAGGSVTRILSANYNSSHAKQSDIDIFIYGASFDARARAFERVLDWFKMELPKVGARVYYAVRGSVTTIYISDVPRKFQIVSGSYSTPYDVISRFDLAHVQWFTDGKRFMGSAVACKAARERITWFTNAAKSRVERLVKTLHCGYSIRADADILKFIDITPVLADRGPNSQLARLIRSLYSWYHPKSATTFEEHMHIMCMIEKDANASVVTDDPIVVLNNISIGGNFDVNYVSSRFDTFNASTILLYHRFVHDRKITLKTRVGIVQHSTPLLRVVGVEANEEGLHITCEVTNEAFAAFCMGLETNVFRLFKNEPVTSHLVNDGAIRFTMMRQRLEYQAKRGRSYLTTQRGEPLNLEEDVVEGDMIQVLFTIDLEIRLNDRHVELRPMRFIKIQDYVLTTSGLDGPREANRDTAPEIQYEDI